MDIDLILRKFYKNNSELTIKNKRTAYIMTLQNKGFLALKEGKYFGKRYEFIKRPEWISEIDMKEIQDRRLVELQVMRKN